MSSAALPPETTLPGPVARAVAVAYAEFSRSGQDVTDYTVDILTLGSECEIVFVPAPPPGQALPRGGRTAVGREVHVHVRLATGEITSTHFAR